MALVACKECNHEVSTTAKLCPECGVKNPGMKPKDYLIGFGVIIFLGFLLSQCSSDDPEHTSKSDSEQKISQTSNWYEGGTLHSENAVAWQQATYKNKLATCADLIAAMYQKEMLSAKLQNQISSVQDIKPLAQELVLELDAAFKPAESIDKNKQIYTNQSIKEAIVMLLTMKGWFK
ncbi:MULTISPECIES: hypothetical protein [Pseudoalteromonas]|uniref:hypothetical protein n=1 Tax=Pseudoalteromonas TaxID=53246 RepID=UPI000C34D22B|nr:MULTISPECIES: hypothetical protein [Pseudoalteromonas]PKG62761.1 hypothetical protein CXF75_18150 [Pseudoalteromonas arctica]PKG70497.1 hypothetical protein CXF64_10990 [Pseudoalteromonas sp. GutCa3]